MGELDRAHAVVVDSNVLREERTVERLAADHRAGGPAIAIPEIALFEMTKNADCWESTVRRSLREVARFPDAVVLTTALKPLGVGEHRAGQPTASVISPRTDLLRQVLRDLAAGSGDSLDAFLAKVKAGRQALEHASHAVDSRATMQALDKVAAPVTDRRERASVSDDLARGNRGNFRKLAIAVLQRSVNEAALAKITSARVAAALWATPSVTALHALAMGLLALEWVMRGGVHSASPKRVANDVLDWEYALTAFWTEGYCCADRGAADRFEDMRILGQAVWPDFVPWFSVPKLVRP